MASFVLMRIRGDEETSGLMVGCCVASQQKTVDQRNGVHKICLRTDLMRWRCIVGFLWKDTSAEVCGVCYTPAADFDGDVKKEERKKGTLYTQNGARRVPR